jgi:glycosyltransferase involved in cell wall biosynthesis
MHSISLAVSKTQITPLVSIIIPCYNYGQYIEKCMQSALDQTYKNIEVIVVDNGSTDDSLEKINTFCDDARVKIIELEENIPPGTETKSAVGIAINKSSGDYISILYADDWYLPNKIEKQINLFNNIASSVGVVYCHGYRYFDSTTTLEKWKMQSVRGYVFKDYMLNGDVLIPISPLVKRYCYEIIGLNNLWTGSEYDYLIMSQYVDFDFVDDHLVVMREHEKNDAKNTHSVYRRVKTFHTEALLSTNARSRAGSLVNKRVAQDYLSYGLAFITKLDMRHGREAVFGAIKVYPLYLTKPSSILAITLLFLPFSVSKYLLTKLGKLSPNSTTSCD